MANVHDVHGNDDANARAAEERRKNEELRARQAADKQRQREMEQLRKDEQGK